MSSSPAGITSEAPQFTRKPVAVNVAKVKKQFSKLTEIFAIHAKDMRTSDVATFSKYTEKYKDIEARYDNVQKLMSSGSVSSAFDRFIGHDDGQIYADRFAMAASCGSDMKYFVIQMNYLVEEFIPEDDTDELW